MTEKLSEFDFGVVTFLDILGWKGIWERNENPLEPLDKIMQLLNDSSTGHSKIDIINISDTIAIFSKYEVPPKEETEWKAIWGKFEKSIEIKSMVDYHGLLLSYCLPSSIDYEIPIRGATSVGDFIFNEGRFLGPAVDEAAEWYEAADWIGVHLTPSAKFSLTQPLDHWVNYPPPFKKGPSWETPCINWTRNWFSDQGFPVEVRKYILQQKFLNLGPIGPDIVGKFTNTLKFFDQFVQDEVPTA